jgi:hypothetical protein
VDTDAALDALRRRGDFNVIDLATGWKVDLITRKSRAFRRLEFDGRHTLELHDMQVAIATAAFSQSCGWLPGSLAMDRRSNTAEAGRPPARSLNRQTGQRKGDAR